MVAFTMWLPASMSGFTPSSWLLMAAKAALVGANTVNVAPVVFKSSKYVLWLR